MQADVLHVLRGGELFEKFDRMCRPAGDVLRELLQHQRGALAAAEGDGVGDFGTRRGQLGAEPAQRPVADEIADIGRHPLGAGFDELVVVELVD